jgi:hypothetical protein
MIKTAQDNDSHHERRHVTTTTTATVINTREYDHLCPPHDFTAAAAAAASPKTITKWIMEEMILPSLMQHPSDMILSELELVDAHDRRQQERALDMLQLIDVVVNYIWVRRLYRVRRSISMSTPYL